jgi:hypothetical protein
MHNGTFEMHSSPATDSFVVVVLLYSLAVLGGCEAISPGRKQPGSETTCEGPVRVLMDFEGFGKDGVFDLTVRPYLISGGTAYHMAFDANTNAIGMERVPSDETVVVRHVNLHIGGRYRIRWRPTDTTGTQPPFVATTLDSLPVKDVLVTEIEYLGSPLPSQGSSSKTEG